MKMKEAVDEAKEVTEDTGEGVKDSVFSTGGKLVDLNDIHHIEEVHKDAPSKEMRQCLKRSTKEVPAKNSSQEKSPVVTKSSHRPLRFNVWT